MCTSSYFYFHFLYCFDRRSFSLYWLPIKVNTFRTRIYRDGSITIHTLASINFRQVVNLANDNSLTMLQLGRLTFGKRSLHLESSSMYLKWTSFQDVHLLFQSSEPEYCLAFQILPRWFLHVALVSVYSLLVVFSESSVDFSSARRAFRSRSWIFTEGWLEPPPERTKYI